MTLFLSSSPCMEDSLALNPANQFIERLKAAILPSSRALFIASDPQDIPFTVRIAEDMQHCFSDAGICFSRMDILDCRNAGQAAELVCHADVIFLAGGHVPTQNAFFSRIQLKEHMASFNGVVIGISAGTMNSAETVYAQPELPGESLSAEYQRFLPGLALTRRMILPHYQKMKDAILDGRRLYEDITYGDSYQQVFYALPDGSYLYSENGNEQIMGEAYCISDGRIGRISENGQVFMFQ